MKSFCIFIDESGMANPRMHNVSPYFSLCGVVINEESRDKLKKAFEKLKITHFKNNLILHSTNIRRMLKTEDKIEAFAKDTEKVLGNFGFFLLYVVVNNEKAKKYSWTNKAVYKKAYREIIGNLIKFLIAKNAIGKIFSEASNVFQDISLYENFFHYIANGIPNLAISPADVKKHLTSISFVTKANNDTEEQIADLLGCMGRIKTEIDNKIKSEKNLDSMEKVLFKITNKYLFVGHDGAKGNKAKLYKSINSFASLP
jgi:hypothetical protein